MMSKNEKCIYCTGYRKDRESLINRQRPKLDIFVNENNEIEAYDGTEYISEPIKYCPICGRKFNTENSK